MFEKCRGLESRNQKHFAIQPPILIALPKILYAVVPRLDI
jgi:hypothetical protein